MKYPSLLAALSFLGLAVACSSSSSDGGGGGAPGSGGSGTAGSGGGSGSSGSGGGASCMHAAANNAVCEAYSSDTPVAWDCPSSEAFNDLVIAHTGACENVDGLGPNGACCDN